MATRQSHKRLHKEHKAILENPPQYIIAHPNDSNVLEWHYLITGPPQTPYEGGQYHGTLTFPADYPFKPPAIRMITPNGRFNTNTRLCLSMSDFHPDTWNPAWSVATILTGLLSFMTGNEATTGSIETTEAQKRAMAANSRRWNNTSVKFIAEFPEIVQENVIEIAKQQISAVKAPVVEVKDPLKEKVITEDEIVDPEDKIRAQPGTGVEHGSGSTWVYVLVAFAVLLVGMSMR